LQLVARESSIFGGMLHMVNQNDLNIALLGFQFDPELLA
jgi:hypothetical protein